MTSPVPVAPPAASRRLKFIDMARSVAILLMLEGHFVGVVLAERWRDESLWGYQVWNFFRGIAAPMFFTVAGLVFVYLLTGNRAVPFPENPRVRKGLKRALILLFWGYALQIQIANVPGYFRGEVPPWVFAFHVLQCIGVGLVALIAVFGVQRWVPRVPLGLCYVAACLAILAVYGWLRMLPEGEHFPPGAHQAVQNLFKGPQSVFPLAPWLAFPMLGGAIGAGVRRWREQVTAPWFPFAFFGVAVALVLASWLAHAGGRWFPSLEPMAWGYAWFLGRTGQIVFVLGVLLVIEHRLRPGDSWFMRVGKHTFPIYVIHVILLYGGLFGIGLKNLWTNGFSPWQAAVGALAFMALFVLLVPLFAAVGDRWERWRNPPPQV